MGATCGACDSLPPSCLQHSNILPFFLNSLLIFFLYSQGYNQTHTILPVTKLDNSSDYSQIKSYSNCRKKFWGSSLPGFPLIHCRGSWSQHAVFRPLKPFYYRKSLWPFILRISHISVVCRRCLIFIRGNKCPRVTELSSLSHEIPVRMQSDKSCLYLLGEHQCVLSSRSGSHWYSLDQEITLVPWVNRSHENEKVCKEEHK